MHSEELRYNALVLAVANLQRLMVFHNSRALVEAVPANPEMRVAEFLSREVRAYYATDLDGPLRTQAAFGAAAVFAAWYLNQGTIRMHE